MSHELTEVTEDVYAFVSAREHAWHRLGVVLDDTMTAEEALQTAHLAGWNVRKVSVSARDVAESNGGTGPRWIKAPDRFATLMTNPVTGEAHYLGIVGTHYTAFQNEWTTDFLDGVTHESGAHFETAGSIHDFKEVFVSMKMPTGLLVGGVDPVDLYLMARNRHDGQGSFEAHVTPVRPVCANTVTAAVAQAKSSFKIRHTAGSQKVAVEEATRILGLTWKYVEAFQAEAEAMMAKQVTDDKFLEIITGLYGGKPDEDAPERTLKAFENKFESTYGVWLNASGTMENITGTAWGGYQAVVEFTDHLADVRTTKDESLAKAFRAATNQNTLALKADAWKAFAAV